MSATGPKRTNSKIKPFHVKNQMSNEKINCPLINSNSKTIKIDLTQNKAQSHRNEHQDSNITSNLVDILDKLKFNNKHAKYGSQNITSDFRKKIDNLNLNFYLETEKYMNKSVGDNKCIGNLFAILFEELNIYNEEIDKLTTELENKRQRGNFLEQSAEFTTKNKLIQSLKESKEKLEERLSNELEKNNNLLIEIEKLKKENEIYKKENENYKLKYEVTKYKSKDQIKSARESALTMAGSNISNDKLSLSLKKKKSGRLFDSAEKENLFTTFGEEKWKTVKKKLRPQIFISDLTEDFKNMSCVHKDYKKINLKETSPQINLTKSNFTFKVKNEPPKENLLKHSLTKYKSNSTQKGTKFMKLIIKGDKMTKED
ncbi:MAG: hypothetical protein MJ252_02585 [archaeon]|nr:hypothetical protein [archaeon]